MPPATARQGKSFSTAMNAAMSAIHPMLMTPRARSAAIRAQQQPTHHMPCSTPMRRAPALPGRHEWRMNMSGLRQRRRQASLSGVSW
jgi:hypothetical protein